MPIRASVSFSETEEELIGIRDSHVGERRDRNLTLADTFHKQGEQRIQHSDERIEIIGKQVDQISQRLNHSR